ncbi:MAG: HAD family hydrolase [Candidatus Peribacteraceae bacterium]|nr:HAD family hydrolase [Candidatus Peribacteraceae bacterium]
MFELLVFDLDGTLLNSSAAIMKALNITFAKIGLGPYDWDNDIVRFFGKPFEYWAETLLREEGKYTEENFKNMTDGTWKAYEKTGNESELNKGAKELLEGLRKKGIKMAVATNMKSGHAKIFLPHLGIDKYFEIVCTASDVKNGKPYTDQMDCILEKVRVDKENVLMVGDTVSDVEFAENSKVKIALLTTPWNNDLKSDYKVKELTEILDFV